MVAVNPLISVDRTRGNAFIPLVNFYFMKGLAIITCHGWLAVQVLFPNAPFLGFHIFHKYQCLKIG